MYKFLGFLLGKLDSASRGFLGFFTIPLAMGFFYLFHLMFFGALLSPNALVSSSAHVIGMYTAKIYNLLDSYGALLDIFRFDLSAERSFSWYFGMYKFWLYVVLLGMFASFMVVESIRAVFDLVRFCVRKFAVRAE